ncbi:MAG: response regulator transcription factor [Elusimicrobia bacterium]|nr:response regulator transcription factor [Elusimicrobiota bacterium]
MTSKKATILLVDDDPTVVAMVSAAVKAEGYALRTTSDANRGFAYLTEDVIDLALLDIQLPGISGLKLLELMKQDPRTAHIPVLMLTLRKAESDKVTGLKTGADDYLGKPFSVKELLARVEALLRRTRHGGKMNQVFEIAGIRVDLGAMEVRIKNKKVELTPTEMGMLVRLLQHPGQVLTYRILSEALSEGSKIITSETLYAHVNHLRDKLGASGERIETVYGVGYKFRAD